MLFTVRGILSDESAEFLYTNVRASESETFFRDPDAAAFMQVAAPCDCWADGESGILNRL